MIAKIEIRESNLDGTKLYITDAVISAKNGMAYYEDADGRLRITDKEDYTIIQKLIFRDFVEDKKASKTKEVLKYLWANKDGFCSGKLHSEDEIKKFNLENRSVGFADYDMRLDWSVTKFEVPI